MRSVISTFAFGLALVAPVQLVASPAEAASLYKRLGGKPAIRAVVETFVQKIADDNRINGFFAKTNLVHLRYELAQQICSGSGGPCRYTGKSMRAAHRGLGVRNQDFNALVGDLKATLVQYGVPAREQGELLAILGPMRRDIVTR